MDLLNYSQLEYISQYKSNIYQNAKPVPHIVLDNICDPKILYEIQSFPPPSDSVWYRYDNFLEKKLATNKLQFLPHVYTQIFQELNSSPFLLFLQKLTGIANLIPDPHLNGGGLHRIEPGGKLDIHADYNYHPQTRLDRRLNVLIYLNQNWKEEYGGHFELWNSNMTQAVQKYLPIFNRMVIFNVSDIAYHGHPDPLKCPDGEARKALAIYYYTNGSPEEEKTSPHSTVYVPRPGDNINSEIQDLRNRRARGRLSN